MHSPKLAKEFCHYWSRCLWNDQQSAIHALPVRFLSEKARILKIGCGYGRDAAFLVAKGYDVTAIEASPKMIDVAQRLHPELAGRIIPASVPLRDSDRLLSRQFRAVVCIGTIIHVPDILNYYRHFVPIYRINHTVVANTNPVIVFRSANFDSVP
ncbi:MAG: methyltransferase domain-containing protein [Desulfomonilaceae bacterium]